MRWVQKRGLSEEGSLADHDGVSPGAKLVNLDSRFFAADPPGITTHRGGITIERHGVFQGDQGR